MLSFSRVLMGCAVGLLSVCGSGFQVMAGPVGSPVDLLNGLAGQELNLLVYSAPNTLLPGEPLGGYSGTVTANSPYTFFLGDPSDTATPTLSVDSSGGLHLLFPRNPNNVVFSGDELFFNGNENPLPFFIDNIEDYSHVVPAIETSGSYSYQHGNPVVTTTVNGGCKPGHPVPLSFAVVGNTPTLEVNADGSISINIFTGSSSEFCAVTYNWGTEAQINPPCGTSGVSGCTYGDPQFTGFAGQSFQVHGVSNSVYNVLSTPRFQLNALFTYLESGNCRAGTTCFAHPGNYFGEIGILLMDQDGKISNLRIVAGSVDIGMQVLLNDQSLVTSVQAVQIGDSSVVFGSAFELTVETPEFSLKLANSDMFLNEDIVVNLPLAQKIQAYKQAVKRNDSTSSAQLAAALPHGLLGQTWEYKTYPNRWKFIQGQLFDYTLADGIFGSAFAYNRFVAK